MKPLKTIGHNLEFKCFLCLDWQIAGFKFMDYANMLLKLFGI